MPNINLRHDCATVKARGATRTAVLNDALTQFSIYFDVFPDRIMLGDTTANACRRDLQGNVTQWEASVIGWLPRDD